MVDIYIYIYIYLRYIYHRPFFPDLFSPKDPKTFGWEGNHLNVRNLPLPSWIGASNKNTGKISLVILAPLAFRKMLVSFSFHPISGGKRPTIWQSSWIPVEFLFISSKWNKLKDHLWWFSYQLLSMVRLLLLELAENCTGINPAWESRLGSMPLPDVSIAFCCAFVWMTWLHKKKPGKW